MKKWTSGMSRKQMKLYVDAWYPNWLKGTSPSADRVLLVDRIQHVQN